MQLARSGWGRRQAGRVGPIVSGSATSGLPAARFFTAFKLPGYLPALLRQSSFFGALGLSEALQSAEK